jgi:hypothetical protein
MGTVFFYYPHFFKKNFQKEMQVCSACLKM